MGSWSENENRESNYTVYTIKGSAYGTSKETVKDYYDNTLQSGGTEESSTGENRFELEIYDIDGTYYIEDRGEMVKLESFAPTEDDDAFDGHQVC